MTGVMLPLAAGVNAARLKTRLIILAIDVRVVDIDIAVNIDVDVAAAPVTAAPRGANRYAGSE